MFITFGTRFYGKVATVNNQWIETKFFSVMFIPIFPVSSIFVTESAFRKRIGFDIALNEESIIATYCRLLTIVLAGFMFFQAYDYGDRSFMPGALGVMLEKIVLGLMFVAASVYFWFYYGKATPADISVRNKVGSITGMYAQPHWFDYPRLRNMLKTVQLEYKEHFPGSDWKTDLMSEVVPRQKTQLLYGIALFNCMVYDLPENDELYAKADSLYAG